LPIGPRSLIGPRRPRPRQRQPSLGTVSWRPRADARSRAGGYERLGADTPPRFLPRPVPVFFSQNESPSRPRTRVTRRRRSPRSANVGQVACPAAACCPSPMASRPTLVGRCRSRPRQRQPCPNRALASECRYAIATRWAREVQDRHPARIPSRPVAVFFFRREGPPRAVSDETTYRRNRPAGARAGAARCAEPPQADPLPPTPAVTPAPSSAAVLRYREPLRLLWRMVLRRSNVKALQNQGCCGVAAPRGREAIGEKSAAGLSQRRGGGRPIPRCTTRFLNIAKCFSVSDPSTGDLLTLGRGHFDGCP